MKWRPVRLKDGSGAIDKLVIESDTHSIVKVTDQLFICFRGKMSFGKAPVIIGRLSTAAAGRAHCEADHEGKPYPPDTTETYPPGKPTLDTPAGPGKDAEGATP